MEAAVRVVREQGVSALSVRNIAKELHVSTQPLYSEFENFDSLKEELLPMATVLTPNVPEAEVLARSAHGGADAVLIGETLMRAEDKKAKLLELKGEA